MNAIERYVERILAHSTPEAPLWNIEKINQGNINGWNYIDGCMMNALLNLYHITGNDRYYKGIVEGFSVGVHIRSQENNQQRQDHHQLGLLLYKIAKRQKYRQESVKEDGELIFYTIN